MEGDPTRPCPFCPGREDSMPLALETYGPGGQWLVRVVPNLYPAFDGNAPMVVTHLGPVFTQAPASGIHEVLVLTPDHGATWADLPEAHSGLVMAAIRDRMEEHASLPGLRYSQAVVNSGREAGASIEHPHGQLLSMPFVPGEIADELAGFARFQGNCLLCAVADAEEEAGHRVVYADERVVVVCPFWSGTPYQALILPRAARPAPAPGRPGRPGCGGPFHPAHAGCATRPARRRRLQHHVPLGPVPGEQRLPLARPPVAEGDDPWRLRTRVRGLHQRDVTRAGGRRAAGSCRRRGVISLPGGPFPPET